MSRALQAFNETLKKAGITNVTGVTISRTISNAETGVQQQLQLKNVSNTADMMEAIRTAEEPVLAVKHVASVAGNKDTTNIKKPLSRKESVNIIRVWDGLSPLPESEIFADPCGSWIGEIHYTNAQGEPVLRTTVLPVDPAKTDAEMIDAVLDALNDMHETVEGLKNLRFVVKDTIGETRFNHEFPEFTELA